MNNPGLPPLASAAGAATRSAQAPYTGLTDDLDRRGAHELGDVDQESIARLDAGVAYPTTGRAGELAVLGRKLTDEEYFQNGVRFTSTTDPLEDPYNIGNALGYPAPGRSGAVQATYRF